MNIEFILTYNSKDQDFIEYPFTLQILKDQQTLFDFATAQLNEEDKEDLIKISSCVITGNEDFEAPEWYKETNGKMWIENGILC